GAAIAVVAGAITAVAIAAATRAFRTVILPPRTNPHYPGEVAGIPKIHGCTLSRFPQLKVTNDWSYKYVRSVALTAPKPDNPPSSALRPPPLSATLCMHCVKTRWGSVTDRDSRGHDDADGLWR